MNFGCSNIYWLALALSIIAFLVRAYTMRRVRRASIPHAVRDQLERYGEHTIQLVLANGLNPREPWLVTLYNDNQLQGQAVEWLTQRGDEHFRHEQLITFVEWGILVWVIFSVGVEAFCR